MTKLFSMMKYSATAITVCGILLSAGCSEMQISNPFATPSTAAGNTYFGGFTDIPIPSELELVADRTLINTLPSGEQYGVLTAHGRIESNALYTFMIGKMQENGWTLTRTQQGKRSLQIYEKDGREAVIFFNRQTVTGVNLEIWVPGRPNPNIFPQSSYHYGSSALSSSSYSDRRESSSVRKLAQ